MRILHLISDHQVTERTLGIYEKVFPGCNDVLVFHNSREPFKRLKGNYVGRIVNNANLKNIAANFDFSGITYVISHYMTVDKIKFIDRIPRDISVCWEIYGGDLYNQFLAPMGYPLQYINSHRYESFRIKMMRKSGLFILADSLFHGNSIGFSFIRKSFFKRITERIDSISVCCYGDAMLLEQYSGRKYKVFRAFNYSLKETLGDLYDINFYERNGILIGNSASFTNNHLYVAELIQSLCPKDIKLIIPLSYGGNNKYKKDIVKKYSLLFPNQVEFLMDYMPLHEYNKLFLNINVMVLASWRQESIGTIFMGLYLGVKVFMSKNSPLYTSLKNEGFVIYEIESSTKEFFLKSLTLDQKKHNRELLLKNYDERVFEEELKRQFN